MVQRTMLGVMADSGHPDQHHHHNNHNNNVGETFNMDLKTEPFHSTSHDHTTLPLVSQEADAGVCAGCGGKILDRYYLMAVDRQWHVSCLRCSDCQLPLDSEATCFARDGNIFCKEDYYRRFATKTCARCQLTIASSELVMRARENVYHLNCFTCASCNKLLTTGEHFGMRHHFVYCRTHYEMVLHEQGGGGIPGEFLPEMSPVFTDLQIPPPHHQQQQPFYNGTGASHKGRPRKRKSPGPGTLPDSDPTMQQLGLGPNENEAFALGQDGYLMQPSRQKRMRTSFKHHQLRIMKSYFSLNHNPDAKDLKQLAQKTGLSKRVLQVWFQNARAKHRRSVTKQDGDKPSSDLSGQHSDTDCMTHGSNSNSATEDVLADLSDSKSPGALSDMGSTVSLSELNASGFEPEPELEPEDVKPPVSSSLTELFSSSLHAMT